MFGSLNKVQLIGNVGKDPEKIGESGDYFRFSLATTTSKKQTDGGGYINETIWHNIVIFNKHLKNVIEKYVKKGVKLYVEGELNYSSFTDQNGNEVKTTKIIVSSFDGKISILSKLDQQNVDTGYGAFKSETRHQKYEHHSHNDHNSHNDGNSIIDDEIPF